MSTPYRVCPDCGSNLDPGERCDCKERKEAGPAAGMEAEKKAALNQPRPALAVGA